VVWFSFHFLNLVVSFSGGQLFVVGFLCYILRFFFGEFVFFFFFFFFFRVVLCFESY
jgi:hypothetical protein